MKGSAEVRVSKSPGGALRFDRLRSCAALTIRRAANRLYIVSGAATPIGGDDTTLQLDLGPGVGLEVSAVSAAVARPGGAEATSRTCVIATLAEGSSLAWSPPSGIAAQGSHHRSEVSIALSGDATCWWREGVVLGRVGEGPGVWESFLNVTRDGMAVLRHHSVLGAPGRGMDGPAVIDDARAVVTLAGLGVLAPDQAAGSARICEEGSGLATACPLAGGKDLFATAVAASERAARRLAEQAASRLAGTASKGPWQSLG